MKKFVTLLLVVLCAFAVFAEDTNIEDTIYKFGYYLGARAYYSYGTTYGIPAAAFMEGARDIATGAYNMTEEEEQTVVNSFLAYYNEVLKTSNLEFANEFLASNASEKDVITTKSGLQYRVDVLGKGRKITEKDTVLCYYVVVLPNGSVLQQVTEDMGDPAEISMAKGATIEGFREACMAVPLGSTITVWIHPDLAYGEVGYPGYIEPNSMLLYQIQTVSVK